MLRGAIQRGEPLALSAVTLLELAVLFGEGGTRLRVPVQELFAALDPGSGFQVVPLDVEIASEVAALGDALRDPADRAIVATARDNTTKSGSWRTRAGLESCPTNYSNRPADHKIARCTSSW
jgi:PIN domain nuclease of toxin-antitoxin system